MARSLPWIATRTTGLELCGSLVTATREVLSTYMLDGRTNKRMSEWKHRTQSENEPVCVRVRVASALRARASPPPAGTGSSAACLLRALRPAWAAAPVLGQTLLGEHLRQSRWLLLHQELEGKGEKAVSACHSGIASREEGILIFQVSERILRRRKVGGRGDGESLPTQSDIRGALHRSPRAAGGSGKRPSLLAQKASNRLIH